MSIDTIVNNGLTALLERKALTQLTKLKLISWKLHKFEEFCILANDRLKHLKDVQIIEPKLFGKDLKAICMLIENTNNFELCMTKPE